MLLREAMRRAEQTSPIVLTYHLRAQDFDPQRRSLARYASEIVHSVVGISEFASAEVARRNPRLAGRLVTIRNGVEMDAEPTDPAAQQVFSMGRLSAEKGFATLLVAWSIVASTSPHLRLVVAGDGQEMPGLRRLAQHLGIAEAVRFTGWLDQESVRRELGASLLAVVPSVWDEPFGLAAAEAHARGRAVLASDVGALPEIVEDGKTGFLLPPGDPLSLASALRRLIANPAEAVEMGHRAAERAASLLSWAACVDRYEAHFELARRA
jgi:glycosyltransferase involved in cell wall biosynthesis